MIKEERLAAIHLADAGHVDIGELKIEDVQVLAHPFRANGLLDDHHAALDQPAQNDLGDGPAVSRPDLRQRGIGEEVVSSLGKRPPRLDLHAAVAHQLLLSGALKEGVALDLINHRRNLVVLDEVNEPVGIEVRDPDCTRESLAM